MAGATEVADVEEMEEVLILLILLILLMLLIVDWLYSFYVAYFQITVVLLYVFYYC